MVSRVSRSGVVVWAVLVPIFVAVMVLSASAQLPTATILGTVKDSTGGAIVGATVTITNTDTNLVRSVDTQDDGSYRVPALPVGRYSVRTTKEGFQTEQRTGITITVGQEARVDATLQLGSTSQTVTITGEAPLVDTTSSTVGGLVSDTQVTNLPLNGRNYTQLTLLEPGISQTTLIQNGTIGANGMTGMIFSSNGAALWSNMFLLDGAIMLNLDGVNNSSLLGTTLGIDGVKEYKVVTSTFSAEYGLVSGSQSSIVSKGGSNQFHGDAYDYLRNSAMDARNYFDVLDTQNDNGFGTNKSLPYPGKRIPPFQRNNFGGAFGGPIKKDKTFFWGVYEGLRQRLGTTNDLTSLPEACFVNSSGTLENLVPTSIMNVNSYGTCVVGAPSTINVQPIVQNLVDLYPRPNVAGYRNFNFTFPYTQPADENYGQIRVDQNFSASDSAFLRFTDDVSNLTQAPNFPQWITPFHSADQFATVAETHIFSPTVLNTVRLSYSRTITEFTPYTNPPVNLSLIPGAGDFGQLSVSGATNFASSCCFGHFNQGIYTLSDDIFWTKGKHAFKFGVLINNFQDSISINFLDWGALGFSSLSNMFAANWSSIQIPTPGTDTGRYFTNQTYGVYAQDDYRILPRLTLNLGLRYEFQTVPTAANPADRYAFQNPLTAAATTPGPYFINPSLHDFSPRVGFAWDVTGKGTTSVRGGAGIYYDIGNDGTAEVAQALGTPPISGYLVANNVATTPPYPLQLPLVVNTGAKQLQTPRGIQYNPGQTTMAQYNLSVAHQFPWQTSLEVGYVGSAGWHIDRLVEGNPTIPQGYLPNGLPFYCSANDASGKCVGTISSSTVRTNPNFGQYDMIGTSGHSWYNGLQTTVTKRTSNGLQFQFAYTYSKLLDIGQDQAGGLNAGIFQTPNNVDNIDKGPAAFNITHNVKASVMYTVPNFHSDRLIAKPLQGWMFASLISAQSGYPFTPTLASDRVLQNNYGMSARPNWDPSYNPATVITGNPQQWFNPTMFDVPAAGYLGNAGRNFLSGPGFEDVDFSVIKDTKAGFLGEAGNIEFRAEIFNILNHPNFGQPATAIWSGTASSAAGQVGSVGGPTILGTAGAITQTANYSRQIQLALKVIF